MFIFSFKSPYQYVEIFFFFPLCNSLSALQLIFTISPSVYAIFDEKDNT